MPEFNPDLGGPRPSDITFQLSLDQKSLSEAIEMAGVGVAAGIHVIEAGTILILSEGAQHVLPRLKALFPGHPLVADVKCTDGVGPEVGLMFDLGASKATVMASASDASIRSAVQEAARRPGCEVMVDTMGCGGPEGLDIQGQIDAAKRARDLGAHYVVLHLGYDERTANKRMVEDNLLLRWAEAVAKQDLAIKIQVVGGLTLAQAKELPQFGISEIVISMNLGTGQFSVYFRHEHIRKTAELPNSVTEDIGRGLEFLMQQSGFGLRERAMNEHLKTAFPSAWRVHSRAALYL